MQTPGRQRADRPPTPNPRPGVRADRPTGQTARQHLVLCLRPTTGRHEPLALRERADNGRQRPKKKDSRKQRIFSEGMLGARVASERARFSGQAISARSYLRSGVLWKLRGPSRRLAGWILAHSRMVPKVSVRLSIVGRMKKSCSRGSLHGENTHWREYVSSSSRLLSTLAKLYLRLASMMHEPKKLRLMQHTYEIKMLKNTNS